MVSQGVVLHLCKNAQGLSGHPGPASHSWLVYNSKDTRNLGTWRTQLICPSSIIGQSDIRSAVEQNLKLKRNIWWLLSFPIWTKEWGGGRGNNREDSWKVIQIGSHKISREEAFRSLEKEIAWWRMRDQCLADSKLAWVWLEDSCGLRAGISSQLTRAHGNPAPYRQPGLVFCNF